MKKAKHWYDYLWVCAILYFTLGFFNILFAWLGMIDFLLPRYIAEGKANLIISIGCTGGKHRSVTLANELYRRLSNAKDYGIRIEHRDLEKDAIRKGI